jgi:hypothetical protein
MFPLCSQRLGDPVAGVAVFEGENGPQPVNGQKWLRLLVRQAPLNEDLEAENLLREFARALEGSQYSDEFLLSIFRIQNDDEPSFGTLPKIENQCEGIEEVREYLSTYAEDVKVPITI